MDHIQQSSFPLWKDILGGKDDDTVICNIQQELAGSRDANAQTKNRKSALHYAAKYGKINAAKYLIDQGADVNAVTPVRVYYRVCRPEKIKLGWTPLHYATRRDDAQMIRLLLELGADPAVQSFNGETPYELAWIEAREDALWALVEANAMRRGGDGYLGKRVIGRRDLPSIYESFPGNQVVRPYLSDLMAHLQSLLPLKPQCTDVTAITNFRGSDLAISEMLRMRSRKKQASYTYSNSGSMEAFRLAAAWVYRCLSSHPDCSASRVEAPKLPSRILDLKAIEGSYDLCLRETQEVERSIYCTLSYRWPRNPFKTTQHNLDQVKQRIYFEHLPNIIRDAITIARILGFRYLWIDALCIIQDSKADWAREAVAMASIYQNSLLTITALTTTDSSPDIFQEQKRDNHHRLDHDDSMLHSRGWVLQEQILSRRILSYADDAMFWNCLQFQASDSEPNRSQQDPFHRSEDEFRFRRVLNGHEKTQIDWEKQAYWLWRRAVTRYTIRNLTFETDRLAAISGIATAFSTCIEDDLVAGIWRNRLAEHLSWWVGFQHLAPRHLAYAGLEENEEHRILQNSRQTAFKSPSWSWLSVSGPISYGNPSKYGDPIGTDFSRERKVAGGFISMIDVVDLNVTHSLESADNVGYIKLRGSLMKAHIRQGGHEYRLWLTPGKSSFQKESNRPYSPGPEIDLLGRQRPAANEWEPWLPDIEDESYFNPLQEREIFCFHLGNGGDIENHLFQYCLCLIPTGRGEQEYKRVGFCAWNPRHVDLRCPEMQNRYDVFPGPDRFGSYTTALLQTITIV